MAQTPDLQGQLNEEINVVVNEVLNEAVSEVQTYLVLTTANALKKGRAAQGKRRTTRQSSMGDAHQAFNVSLVSIQDPT